MKIVELTDEDLKTLIDALGEWLADDRPDERTWLSRQDRGGFLDIELRELLNRDDGWDGGKAEGEFIQAGIDAREMSKECQDPS